jgi:CubicO group peptidase (beta-lactamase class C family)
MLTLKENLDQFFKNYQGNVPGAAIGRVQDKEILTRCYGLSKIDEIKPVTVHTTFRLASLTKTFTAACILKLVEEDKLNLTNCINDVIKDFPDYGKNITIKNLLQHTSGIVEYSELNVSEQLLDNDVLEQLKAQTNTITVPGSKYEYSNAGYVLLGIIISKVTGVSLLNYMHENIFKPLKMDDTVLYLKGKNEIKNRAYGYAKINDVFKLNDQSKASLLLGDGGIYSSITDLIKLDQSLYTDKLLSYGMWNEAFSNGQLNNGEQIEYGYGWHLMNHHGLKCVYHGGSTAGFRNLIFRIPEKLNTFIILTNRNTVDVKTSDNDSFLGAKDELSQLFVPNIFF